jgi:hypothetical protein
MTTFKKLGLTMERTGMDKRWYVSGNNVPSYANTGNKGTVMMEALAHWERMGVVQFVKGRGWEYAGK